MDYARHYSLLINRAIGRTLEGYTEKHHILPRCMGGTDDAENLVRLTAREHFVAHQLLVKMHPGAHDLALAFRMLSTANYGRTASRTHAWLRARMADASTINMRRRNTDNPEILERARANFTEASLAKQRVTFSNTMAIPGVRERRSQQALARWENDVLNKKLASERLRERQRKANGRPIGRDTSMPVAQMFEGGFVVVEHPTVKAAAAFAGLNRCTIRDRVKRNHPLWGYVK